MAWTYEDNCGCNFDSFAKITCGHFLVASNTQDFILYAHSDMLSMNVWFERLQLPHGETVCLEACQKTYRWTANWSQHILRIRRQRCHSGFYLRVNRLQSRLIEDNHSTPLPTLAHGSRR